MAKDEAADVKNAEVAGLTDLVKSMKEQLDGLSSVVKPFKPTMRKKDRERVTTMRGYIKEQGSEEIQGIVTRLYNVREVRDLKENKKFYGLCNLEVMNPATKKVEVVKDIDYLEFLNNAPHIPLRIKQWKKKRDEIVVTSGLYRVQGKENEYLSDNEIDYFIEEETHSFVVEVMSGQWAGVQFESNGNSFNI